MAATWIEEPLDVPSGPPAAAASTAGPRHLRVSRPGTRQEPDRRPPATPLVGSDLPSRLGQHPLLTAAEEVELSKRIEAGVLAADRLSSRPGLDLTARRELRALALMGDEAKATMIRANLRLVIVISRGPQGRGLELIDLFQEGVIGLIRAVEKFDHTRGFKFSTYATWWIRQSITRAVADTSQTIRLPVHVGDQIRRLGATYRRLTAELGRAPTVDEVADAAELTVGQVDALRGYRRRCVSLDSLVPVPADERGSGSVPVDGAWFESLGSQLVDPDEPPVEERHEMIALRAAVLRAVGTLKPRQAKVIALRFGLDGVGPLTLEEIGTMYGLTRERIRQIEAKALERLRHPATAAILREWAPAGRSGSAHG